MRGKYKEKMK